MTTKWEIGKKNGFRCDHCGRNLPARDPIHHNWPVTGYGVQDDGSYVCFACCGEVDRQCMFDHDRIILYLDIRERTVSNWPGTLKFHVYEVRKGTHNIAGTRIDVWFVGPDGYVWWGVLYGDFTQIVHCKRTKELAVVDWPAGVVGIYKNEPSEGFGDWDVWWVAYDREAWGYNDSKARGITRTRVLERGKKVWKDLYPGVGLSGHGDCVLGPHLGVKCQFHELPEDLKRTVRRDLAQ